MVVCFFFIITYIFESEIMAFGPFLRYNTIFLTIYIYLVVYSGALVRHTESSLACLSWPHCQPGQFWAMDFYQWVQMGHRALAGIVVIWIFIIMLHAIRYYSRYKVIRNGWILAFVLVLLQATTGMLSVFTLVNIFIALLHALFITLLFGLLCYFIMLLSRTK